MAVNSRMTMAIRTVFCLACLVSGIGGPASIVSLAAAENVHGMLIGTQSVGFGRDEDVVRLSPKAGKFRSIRLHVTGNDIYLTQISIVQADGTHQSIPFKRLVKRNTWTPWYDLETLAHLDEIRLSYRSRPSFRGQARVAVYGAYVPGWLGPGGDGQDLNDGWVLLGAQTAGFIGFDHDALVVGLSAGAFRQLKVVVRERAITLSELRVVYGDGEREAISAAMRIGAGDDSGPIDLRHAPRSITRITLKYRSRFFDRSASGKGRAIVEVWGRYFTPE